MFRGNRYYLLPKVEDIGISSVTFKIECVGKYNNIFIGISGEDYSQSANEYLGMLSLDWCCNQAGFKFHNIKCTTS